MGELQGFSWAEGRGLQDEGDRHAVQPSPELCSGLGKHPETSGRGAARRLDIDDDFRPLAKLLRDPEDRSGELDS